MNPAGWRFATLMGSASFLTLTTTLTVHAQEVAQTQTAQVPATLTVPEQVLVTGSLIHGAAAVGVPVTNLGVQDFAQTGLISVGELFSTIPSANVQLPQATINGGQQERNNRVDMILTDYKLPEFDGVQLVRQLRALPHCVDVPIVVITVAVRLIFNQDHAQTIPVPPPPEIDWEFVDRLPRSDAGKIRRGDLVREREGKLASKQLNK